MNRRLPLVVVVGVVVVVVGGSAGCGTTGYRMFAEIVLHNNISSVINQSVLHTYTWTPTLHIPTLHIPTSAPHIPTSAPHTPTPALHTPALHTLTPAHLHLHTYTGTERVGI